MQKEVAAIKRDSVGHNAVFTTSRFTWDQRKTTFAASFVVCLGSCDCVLVNGMWSEVIKGSLSPGLQNQFRKLLPFYSLM